MQDSLLEALFWRIARGLHESVLRDAFRRLPQAEAQREMITEVFRRHPMGNPTAGELAADAKMSPRHLTSLCKEIFSTSPARLLLHIKLRRAEEMLHYRCQNVKEGSDTLGLANPYHFSRVFKREYGRPPSQI